MSSIPQTSPPRVVPVLLRGAYARLVTGLASTELVDRTLMAVALTDEEGRVVLATETVPLANVAAVVRTCLEYYGALHPGDVVITNDPYSGGTRVQDHFVLTPVHVDGRLVGVAVACAPFVDVGGMVLGNVVPDARDLFTEGVRTRPIRVRRGGRVDEDVIRCLQLNSRVPVLVGADVDVMSEVVTGLAAEAGEALASGALGDRADADRDALRATIAGTLHGTDARSRGSVGEVEDALRLLLTVDDGGVVADFTGSSPQLDQGHFNATIHTTTSAVARALAEAIGGETSGAVLDVVRVVAPERSIVHCAFPVPVGGSTRHTCVEVMRMTTECLATLTRSER